TDRPSGRFDLIGGSSSTATSSSARRRARRRLRHSRSSLARPSGSASVRPSSPSIMSRRAGCRVLLALLTARVVAPLVATDSGPLGTDTLFACAARSAPPGPPGPEVVDRLLAVVSGELILLSDVSAARELGLVRADASGDAVGATLSALIDR